MSSKWEKCSLDKLVLLQRGHDLSTAKRGKGSIPVAGSNGIVGSHDKAKGIVPGVTIGRSGSIGNTQYFESEYFPLNTTLYVTDFLGNHPKYVYYFFKRFDFSAFDSGSVQPSLNRNFLYTAIIDKPDLVDQKAIAHILGTLDEKIELNKKSNETLEGIAKSLFKSWFIDFDPVKAKAEGRSTGLPDEINKLFPDSFEDSELCQIPSGWRFCLSSDLYKVSIGKTPPRKESWWFSKSTKDIPWISIKDMGNSSVYALETSEFLTEDAVNKFNVKVLPEETVIVSFKLTVGRVLITSTKMVTNEAIAHFISHKNLIPSSYSYFLFSNFDFRSLGSTSSIATAVNSKMLREMKILDPPYKLKQAFDQICTPLLQKIKRNLNESSAIEEIKDAILPKLISGQLGIIDAEKIIEEIGI